ncbi:uncharacterized protein FIBRA_08564 [Fibroporia radiculosa]|uniref:Uncharacterized protein n=1 Tax=Fibroporia radiculosa TaxID=599839 RepID=J4I2Y9_9APHY|nr:uncharacterized protein FIBRA_08564 [Fibroporia radiculosa]CCM06312.1 predicted protein [Fibroporia radiculosa]
MSSSLSFSRRRSPTFSLQDFSELIANAFNLPPPHPSPALLPASPPPHYSSTPPPRPCSPSSSHFDADEDADPIFQSESTTTHSNTDSTPHVRPSKSRSSALSILKNVRTRASALVLRPLDTNIDLAATPHASTRPSISSQGTVVSRTTSSFAFLSRPSSPSQNTRPFPSTSGNSLSLARSRSRTKSVPDRVSFLKLHPKRELASATVSMPASRPSLGALPQPPVDLPSFFEDTGYTERRPPPPAYSRPSTPAAPTMPSLRVHSRLPPLRKAKSASTSIFRGKQSKSRGAPTADTVAAAESRTAFDWSASGHLEWPFGADDDNCFMSPRDPPPVPPLPPSLGGQKWDLSECGDVEGELEVPAYVFARRGSATSTCTSSSVVSIRSIPIPSEFERQRLGSSRDIESPVPAFSRVSRKCATGTSIEIIIASFSINMTQTAYGVCHSRCEGFAPPDPLHPLSLPRY